MKILTVAILWILILLTGCAEKKPEPTIIKKIIIHKDKPYRFNYTPIIGTKTPDDKVVVDMGKVIRVWINSYKTKNGQLVASHDVYAWARKPDFIVGTTPPKRINKGILSPLRKMPFMLTNDTINRKDFSDKGIKNYVNTIYSLKNSKKKTKERLEESSKFDEEIKNFLKKLKKEDK